MGASNQKVEEPETPGVALPVNPAIGRITYIDGPSGIGKSTLLKSLEKKCLFLGQALPEYTDFVNQGVVAQKEMPSWEGGLEAHLKFARIWKDVDVYRRSLLQQGQNEIVGGSQNLIDTSPIMVIGFELVKEQKGILTPLDQILDAYLASFDEGVLDIFAPDLWIFLEASPLKIQSRLISRGSDTIHPLLFEESTIRFLTSFYGCFRERYLEPDQCLVLDTEELGIDQVSDMVLPGLPNSKKPMLGLIRFIKHLREARQAALKFEDIWK